MLSAFIQPVINYRETVDGKTSYVSSTLRRCKAQDFTNRGYKLSEMESIKYERRLCPDFENTKKLIAENGYQNTTYRKSFSLEIFVCNKGDDCKLDMEIR